MNYSIKPKILIALSLIFASVQTVPLAASNARVVKVTGGAAFTMALFDDGTLKAWGSNRSGELGLPNTDTESSSSSNGSGKTMGIDLSKKPITVPGIENVKDISSGRFFTIALTTDGSVFGWGDNTDFAIRTTPSRYDVENIFKPVRMEDVQQTQEIHTTFNGSYISQFNGQVFVRGDFYPEMDFHVLSPLKALEFAQEIQGGNGTTLALMEDGTVKFADDKKFVTAKGLSNVVAISAGESHFLALRDDGTVWVWGENNVGQFGNGSISKTFSKVPVRVNGLKDVVEIASGVEHSMALLKDGTIRARGWNAYGQLGNGKTTDTKVPVAVKDLKDVVHIAAGMTHSMAILKDGTLKTWGLNEDGQLGNGTTKNSSLPVIVKF